MPTTPSRLRLDDVERTIRQTRPDLHALYGDDREAFRWWLLLHGTREYAALAEFGLTVPEAVLTEAADGALPQVRPVLTRFMQKIWSLRPDLQEAFDLGTLEGQDGLVWWYFVHGTGEMKLARFLTDAQRDLLNEPDPRLPDGGVVPVTRLMVEVWRRRPDLQQAFDLGLPEGREGFLAWYLGRGVEELDLAHTLDARQAVARAALVPAAGGAGTSVPAEPRSVDGTAPGVNLIGYARGQFGIGEDVRRAALALEAAGIPFSLYNVEPGREVCQGDDSALAHVSDTLPHAVNLFCTTGIETARLAAVHGSRLFEGRRCIGYWPWELPEWPQAWHHAYHLVDEVWASSRFTYEAFARSCPKPVRHMPMAVTVDPTAGLTRRDFGLPADRFLFVFAFDVLSSLQRKNPQACVAAFRRAFPRGDEPVGLVVKAMRATEDSPLWRALQAEARADGRITVISGTLGRGDVLDLYRACDCFVSLHRSEGFGRGLVEAMLLGRPVIATGHSGNMDFTLPGTAGLVDHRPRRLEAGDYPFGEGLVWAEPDVDHAAWWMRRMAADQALRDRLADTARALAENTYAPAVVGAGYAALLGLPAGAGKPAGT
jgi:glycosyltransferase involved in cell wall biosynthesis